MTTKPETLEELAARLSNDDNRPDLERYGWNMSSTACACFASNERYATGFCLGVASQSFGAAKAVNERHLIRWLYRGLRCTESSDTPPPALAPDFDLVLPPAGVEVEE